MFLAKVCLSLFSSKQCIIKTIITFSFCDILSNQGVSLTETLIILGITKNSSNNCLQLATS